MLMAGLDRLDQGITLFGPDLKLVFANSRLVELVGLPQALAEPGAARARRREHLHCFAAFLADTLVLY